MRFAIVLLAIFALAACAAHAAFDVGANARAVAMGGTGLAVINDPIVSGAINPAAYAENDPKLRFLLPSLYCRFKGTSLSKLIDISNNLEDTSDDNAIELAQELGERDALLEVAGVMGFSMRGVVVTVDSQANADIIPSTQFKDWARDTDSIDWSAYVNPVTGTPDLAALQGDFYTDVTGQLVTSLPAVGFGWNVKSLQGLKLGIRLKSMRSSVRRQRVTVSSAVNNGTAADPDVSLTLDAYMPVGVPELVTDTGFGADCGLIYQTPNPKLQLTTAVIVHNMLEPNLEAVRVDRMLSAGAAVRLKNSLLVTADLVNINKAYDKDVQLRVGAELKPFRNLAFRAGYGDGNPTFGLGYRGYDLALSEEIPLTVGRLWKF
jgi:hypothetical protein